VPSFEPPFLHVTCPTDWKVCDIRGGSSVVDYVARPSSGHESWALPVGLRSWVGGLSSTDLSRTLLFLTRKQQAAQELRAERTNAQNHRSFGGSFEHWRWRNSKGACSVAKWLCQPTHLPRQRGWSIPQIVHRLLRRSWVRLPLRYKTPAVASSDWRASFDGGVCRRFISNPLKCFRLEQLSLKYGSRRVKKWSRRGDPNLGRKSRLLTLKTNFTTYCQKNLPYNHFFSCLTHAVRGLDREMFTKLRFGSRSMFGNRWSTFWKNRTELNSFATTSIDETRLLICLFFRWDISVIFSWDISVICLTVVPKLTVTVFISLHFRTFWRKFDLIFSVISKTIRSMTEKKTASDPVFSSQTRLPASIPPRSRRRSSLPKSRRCKPRRWSRKNRWP